MIDFVNQYFTQYNQQLKCKKVIFSIKNNTRLEILKSVKNYLIHPSSLFPWRDVKDDN